MQAAYPLKKMNHRHHAILTWLIVNPDRSLKECALALNYSPEWIRILVATEMFQVRYKERCEAINAAALHHFDNRIRGVAALAMDKTEERLSSTRVDPATGEEVSDVSDRFLGDATKNALIALGYLRGNKEPETAAHLHIHVDADDLKEARADGNAVKVRAESNS